MGSYEWNGSTIRVIIRPLGAFLWLAYGIEVWVDQRQFLPTVDHIGLTTYTNFEIEQQDGSRATGFARTLAPIWFLPRTKCAISINQEVIARDVLPLQKYYLTYLAWWIAASLFGMALFGLIIFGFVIYLVVNQ